VGWQMKLNFKTALVWLADFIACASIFAAGWLFLLFGYALQ
jgi:hypothetical protein|tara:strand:+ start:669 stop:791 length:123 start_codon:yes stop_codon:yes gene_type:complete